MGSVIERDLAVADDAGKGAATIFALSSGGPPAGIAVIRVSGPGVADVIDRLCSGPVAPRLATFRKVSDPITGEAIDEAIVLSFPGSASFTGEDVVELHVHGGRAVIAGVLQALGRLPGFRPAEPGEFTRRAFVNGRLDLTEAEGIADLIAAETEAQRRAALEQTQGSIRRQYESWAADLTRARGLLEAEIDFSEEEGLGSVWAAEGRELAAEVADAMAAALADFDRARTIREGLEVVLLGPVNAGKSTLLNAIAGRDVAIVSEEAGTTRDLIEVAVDLGGFKVTLIDSAGLRESEGTVEQEGIRRARQRAAAAELVLWLSDIASPVAAVPGEARKAWTIATKADLPADPETIRHRNEADFVLSAMSGEGVDALIGAIARWARERGGSGEGSALVTRERHRTAVTEALTAVREAIGRVEAEIAADDLRVAANALGRVTGRVDADDVLDIVFREFCIGK